MIDDIAIDLWSSKKFSNMEDIRRKCTSMVDLSKFTFNKKILNKVIALNYNQVCNQTLSFFKLDKLFRMREYLFSFQICNMIINQMGHPFGLWYT